MVELTVEQLERMCTKVENENLLNIVQYAKNNGISLLHFRDEDIVTFKLDKMLNCEDENG